MIYSDRVARHRREVIEPEIIAEGTDSEEERVRRKKDDDESSEEEELEDEEIERRRNLLRQRALQRKEEEVTTIRFLCGPRRRDVLWDHPILCPEHISKTILATVMKLHGWIDLIEAVYRNHNSCLLNFFSHCPLSFFILVFCPEHSSKTILVRVMKFHGWIDLIKGECSATES